MLSTSPETTPSAQELLEQNHQSFLAFQEKFQRLAFLYPETKKNIVPYDHRGNPVEITSPHATDHFYFQGGVGDFCGGMLSSIDYSIDNPKHVEKVAAHLNLLHRYFDLLLAHPDFAQSELNAIYVGSDIKKMSDNERNPEFRELRLLAGVMQPTNVRPEFVRLMESYFSKQPESLQKGKEIRFRVVTALEKAANE